MITYYDDNDDENSVEVVGLTKTCSKCFGVVNEDNTVDFCEEILCPYEVNQDEFSPEHFTELNFNTD